MKSSQSKKQPIESDLNMDFEKVIQDIKIICMNKTHNNFHMKVEYIFVRNSLSVSLKIIVRSGKYKHDRDETKIRVCILLSSNRYLKHATDKSKIYGSK